MKKSEIINRVTEDKERIDRKEDKNSIWVNRRKVDCRRWCEEYEEDRRIAQEDGYD